jgi:eukaryotic-like serine/threonine-protein kinase
VKSAVRVDNKESAAAWQVDGAIREAAFGNADAARRGPAAALTLAPESRYVESYAALAYALAGDAARAQSLADYVARRFPQDTLVQTVALPTIRAQIEVSRKNSAQSIEILSAAAPYELGSAFGGCLSPVYIRGQAYLAAQQDRAAAAEFQKILDHRGIVSNCWTGALAHLGLGRAYALAAESAEGDEAQNYKSKCRAAYQDFLALWKEADPDIPILVQARAEYAKMK